MSVIPGLDNRHFAPALAVGVLAVLTHVLFLHHPQTSDYALLAAEILIGAAVTIVVYGMSRKNEDELREIATNTDGLVQAQTEASQDMEQAAERRLAAVLLEISKTADEIMKSKQAYDAGATRHRAGEIESKCADLAKTAKEITVPLQSVYWTEHLDRFKEIYALCEKGPAYPDGDINVDFCRVVKTEAREWLEDLQSRPEHISHLDEDAGGAQPDLLSVSPDRTVYPLRSTVHVRARVGRPLRGNRIRYEIRDRGGRVLASRDLDPDAHRDSELAQEGIFEVEFKMTGSSWAAGEAYTVRAICGLSSAERAFLIEQSAPSVDSDRDVYVVGSDMVISVTDPDADRDGNAVEYAGDRRDSKLVIESRHGRISGHRLEEVDRFAGIFQGTVNLAQARKGGPAADGAPSRRLMRASAVVFAAFGRILGRRGSGGRIKCGRGEEITIKYTNGAGTAVRTVYTADSGAAVDLDKRAYTCTGRVRITVAAPDLADLRPAARSCPVSVRTSMGLLAGYRLAEREPGSCIFAGSVRLTGFSEMGHRTPADLPFGATRGEGPDDGLLACMMDDTVEVTADVDGKQYGGAAPARWNAGSVQFVRTSYAVGDSPAVLVTDPDMNLDPDAADRFRIRAWSDSDGEGIEIVVEETEPDSGVFEGAFKLDHGHSSQTDGALLASPGDTIYAAYEDTTLPSSNPSDRIEVVSTASVSAGRATLQLERAPQILTVKRDVPQAGPEVPPLLGRLRIESVSAASRKTGSGPLAANDPASIRVAVGGAKNPCVFTVILQIKDSGGAGPAPLLHPARIDPQQTFECEFRWTPPKPGDFVITVYLWRSVENPTPFCPPKEIGVRVV